MATIKHISSKNADYGAAESYLIFQHDEFPMKPALDEDSIVLLESMKDGLLYCGRCNKPKEVYFPEGKRLFGRDRHPSEGDCQRAEREKREAGEASRRHREEVERLKCRGFTDAAMQGWTFGNDSGKCPQMGKARLCSFPLLILDDFGMERGTEYSLEQVYNVIDSRYRSGRPLIVTTNLTLEGSTRRTPPTHVFMFIGKEFLVFGAVELVIGPLFERDVSADKRISQQICLYCS